MFLLNGAPLSPDSPFTAEVDGDLVQFPANWLRLSSPQERAAIGIEEVPDPPTWDQRFAWGYSDDGQLIWKAHSQLVEQWTQQTRTTANTLLQPSDWVIIREADNGKAADPALKSWREAIRLASGSKVAAIQATATSEELANYVTSAEYGSWPHEPGSPLPPAPEPEAGGGDSGEGAGDVPSGAAVSTAPLFDAEGADSLAL